MKGNYHAHFPYSFSGMIADRVNIRYFLTLGMFGEQCTINANV